jgi:CHAT domain
MAVQKMEQCELLWIDSETNYLQLCVKYARKLGMPLKSGGRFLKEKNGDCGSVTRLPDSQKGIRVSQTNSEQKFALLEVALKSRANSSTMTLVLNKGGEGIVRGDPIILDLGADEINDLVEDSRKLTDRIFKGLETLDWNSKHDYMLLGERIHKLVFKGKASELFGFARGAVEGGVRLRFNLDEPVFDGLWEAVFDREDNKFLMLDNTVTRRAVLSDFRFRNRFEFGNNVLNILAVKSLVSSETMPVGPRDRFWEDCFGHVKLSALQHLDREIDVLKRLEWRSKAASKRTESLSEIRLKVLSAGVRRRSLADILERELAENPDRYDVLHFAGHALFAGSNRVCDERGYLIFSGNPFPTAVPIGTVAGWLANTSIKLVYLSCCRSSASQVAVEFAKQQVPMTIGFSWDLDDEKAVDFANQFYTELQKAQLNVCSAFCRARQKLHQWHDGADPIWASPVLVAQPLEWTHIENNLGRRGQSRSISTM